MELSQEEKDRIIAEEKVRFEVRKELMREQCCGRRCGRWGRGCGILKLAIVALILGAIFWHHGNYCGGGYNQPTAQSSTLEAPKAK